MPPMPPMPPPGGIAGIAGFGSGFSATMASVVTSKPATDAASCSACLTTFCRIDDGDIRELAVVSVGPPAAHGADGFRRRDALRDARFLF